MSATLKMGCSLLVGLAVAAGAGCSSSSASSPSDPASDAAIEDASARDASTDASTDAAREAAPACDDTDPRAVPLTLSIQPDDGEAPIDAVMSPAQSSIRLMVFLLGPSNILTILEQKAMAGVKVQVILDQTQMAYNQAAYTALQMAGAKVQWSNPKFAFTHAKTIVVDESVAVVSSGNFDSMDITSNRDFTFIDRDPQDVAQLVNIFDSDWANTNPELSCTRLVVSPVNSRTRIVDLIQSAKKTLDVESLEFGDSQVQQAVAAAAKAGVKVRVLLSDPGFYSNITTAVSEIESRGVTPLDLVTPSLHLKFIMVDGTTAYAGSENLSANSLDNNREVGIITEQADVIAQMAASFDKDWATGVPYGGSSASDAGPTDGSPEASSTSGDGGPTDAGADANGGG